MSLSQKNSNVGTYIAKYSSMCPLLVTGLGGLYSSLPNTFDIAQNDWYRITPDDVADIPRLTLFVFALFLMADLHDFLNIVYFNITSDL